ncbi:HNH endonuclease [Nakamurella lactea]|uniref:HNH endonuclease n=1 Tax=Nakamurella lactea TaxID=459515 RepID=UPI0012B5E247|nr:HNH endonuclease signature motif containing protein [Nakamurella lactea]
MRVGKARVDVIDGQELFASAVELELERLLHSLGDGMVRTIEAFTAALSDATTFPASTTLSLTTDAAGPDPDAAGSAVAATDAVDPATRIDRIAALESARAVLAAAQLAEELAFAKQQRAEQVAAGVKTRKLGRGIAEQVGFARRISPVAAAHHIGLAAVLAERLPEAFKLLLSGEVSEDQCLILATRTSHLSDLDAIIVDAGISPRMSGWNKKQTEQAADRAAYEIDPQGSVDRRAKAEKDRRVWCRPAPDCMAKVTALLPMVEGVAVFKALSQAADSSKGIGGEKRTRGQIMADELVTRVTGQEQAHLVPVEVNLTITADALFGDGDEPAQLEGVGPVPAEYARGVIAGQPPASGPGSEPGADVPRPPEPVAEAAVEPVADVEIADAAPDPDPGLEAAGDAPPVDAAAGDATPDDAGSGDAAAAGEPTGTPPPRSPQPLSPLRSGRRRPRRSSPPLPWALIPDPGSGGESDSCDVTAREFRRAKAWITRILVDPITGVATNIDSRRREFEGTARRFITVRDRQCRQPYCGADIRHADHIVPYREGGPTSIDNGQGLCERGNYAKEIPGWHTTRGSRPGEVITTTPTGHSYRTLPPHQTGMPGTTVKA